jgi:hypothetical protein
MPEAEVRPESIHLAARKVDDAGQDWGESVDRLSTGMESAGDDAYGGDELGAALKEMYGSIGPKALEYFAETGFCVIETADALDQMAKAYTEAEQDNAAVVTEVQGVLESLGDP